MPEFDTSHVKNIVLLGHAGSGKTTLAECMLFEAGIINRRGSIEEKNTVSDYHEMEQERGNSIFSTLLHSKWRGYKIISLTRPVMMILWANLFLHCGLPTPVLCC
jgi:elongation factor G